MGAQTITGLALLLTVCFGLTQGAPMGCRDEMGQIVPWFVIMKHPLGLKYDYLDSKTVKKGFMTVTNHDLGSRTRGAVAHTLRKAYLKSTARIIYNDEDDKGKGSTYRAHAKGVLAAGSGTNGGFWFIHSIPKFPGSTSWGGYGSASTKFGQSILCMSLTAAQVDEVAIQLQVAYVNKYGENAPSWLNATMPQFQILLKEKNRLKVPSRTTKFTLASSEFMSFTKQRVSSGAGTVLWADLVANHYKSPLITETWQNGIGKEASHCGNLAMPHPVLNGVKVGWAHANWTSTMDHSKWGVTTTGDLKVPPSTKVACIGDVNRQLSQNKRGGGTVCIGNADLWSAMHGMVLEIEACPNMVPTRTPTPDVPLAAPLAPTAPQALAPLPMAPTPLPFSPPLAPVTPLSTSLPTAPTTPVAPIPPIPAPAPVSGSGGKCICKKRDCAGSSEVNIELRQDSGCVGRPDGLIIAVGCGGEVKMCSDGSVVAGLPHICRPGGNDPFSFDCGGPFPPENPEGPPGSSGGIPSPSPQKEPAESETGTNDLMMWLGLALGGLGLMAMGLGALAFFKARSLQKAVKSTKPPLRGLPSPTTEMEAQSEEANEPSEELAFEEQEEGEEPSDDNYDEFGYSDD